jgi:putative cofactor-binding repeat protein
LNCALTTLNPGDRVIFEGGVTFLSDGFPMIVRWSGTSSAPIYYGVDPTWFVGSVWSRPVFDFTGDGPENLIKPPVLAESVNYVVFDNFEIKNQQVDSLNTWPPRGGITVEGGTNITIQNCYLHGWSITNPTIGSDENPFGGIAFYGNSSGGVVKNCTFDGSPASDSGTAIYGGTTIQGNIIENAPNGILVSDPDADVSGNQVFNVPYSIDPTVHEYAMLVTGGGNIYNNIVHDLAPAASAIYLQSASEAMANTQYVYNNVVWNVGNNAPLIIDPGNMSAGSASNQSIYNNTLYGGAQGCVGALPGPVAPTNLVVENNQCISDQSNSPAWCWNNASGNANCGAISNPVFVGNVLMTTQTAASQNYTVANGF